MAIKRAHVVKVPQNYLSIKGKEAKEEGSYFWRAEKHTILGERKLLEKPERKRREIGPRRGIWRNSKVAMSYWLDRRNSSLHTGSSL